MIQCCGKYVSNTRPPTFRSYRDMSHRLDEIQRKLSLHQAKRAVVDQPCQQTMTNQTVLDEGPILQSIAEVTSNISPSLYVAFVRSNLRAAPNPPILERDGGGEGENDAVTHPVSPLPPLSTQHSFPLEGSCSILSQQSALWVDTIVGDNSFSQVLQHVEGSQNFPTLHFDASHMDPLPPQNVINDCLAGMRHLFKLPICTCSFNSVRLFTSSKPEYLPLSGRTPDCFGSKWPNRYGVPCCKPVCCFEHRLRSFASRYEWDAK